jgi:hypothetical protein
VCGACGKPYHYAAKQCTICGRHYHPSRKVQYTCGRACGLAFKRLRTVPLPMPSCANCGKSCPTRGRKTCSEQCAAKHQAAQQAAKRKTLICVRCGEEFEGITARWCSPNCQAIAYYYDHRTEVIAKKGPEGTPSRCQDCNGTVWRCELNQVDGGWACASCRRKRMTVPDQLDMTAVQPSRIW